MKKHTKKPLSCVDNLSLLETLHRIATQALEENNLNIALKAYDMILRSKNPTEPTYDEKFFENLSEKDLKTMLTTLKRLTKI